ncbi:MAG: cell division ATP-binding protein FtsE [Chromatiales bacterium]|jgi:cell division transport system ATP-binding protein|nr:cell division ATP-binding protein FtsE [Chromatiales bacterium]
MLRFENVGKRYPGGQEALVGLNMHLRAGEMAFLTGRSGAGKSTLLKLIALIERASYGQIFFNGRSLIRIRSAQIPYLRREIGIIFQNHNLLSDRTVFDNVALPLVIAGYEHREIARRVRAALDKVGLLDKERRYPVMLSGGEQQRVGIARAVVHKPPLLLADEPTGNLDPGLSEEVMRLFAQFNQVGVTVLIASHDLQLISRMGRRILRLEAGRLLTEESLGAVPA